MGVIIRDLPDGRSEITITGELNRRLQKAARELKTTPEALALAAMKATVAGNLEIEKGRKELRRARKGGKCSH